MCTGRPAFAGESTVEVIHRVCEGTPTPIPVLNPEVPGWLVEIIGRLHARDRAARFQGAAEVAELLERHLARLQDPSLPPVVHDWAAAPSPRGPAWRRAARSGWAGTLALIVLGAAIGLARLPLGGGQGVRRSPRPAARDRGGRTRPRTLRGARP